jgi:hypothetical protein
MRPEVSEAFARFIEDAADLKGLIVDVRYNGAGRTRCRSRWFAASSIARRPDRFMK